MGEHRLAAKRYGLRGEGADESAHFWQPHLANGGTDRDRIRQVVDVFARAGEVGELRDVRKAELLESRPHEILDRLNIVAGGGLKLG